MPGHRLQADIDSYVLATGNSLDIGGAASNTVTADTISEITSGNGVVVDSVTLKDGGVTATAASVFTSATLSGTLAQQGIATFGSAAHDGLLHGSGTSSTKYTMTGASKSALSYYVTTADTADSNRCAYLRLYLTGAAGGGEAIRGFCTVGAACSQARGAHISLNYTGTSSITGESMAVKGTYHVPNSTLSCGTSSVLASEVYADGASSDMSGTLAMFGCHVSGNATGVTTLTGASKLLFMNITGVATSGFFKAKSAAAVTHTLQISVDGTPYYIMLSNAN